MMPGDKKSDAQGRPSFGIAGGVEEGGIVVGNAFDKYNSRNPVVQWMMRGFESALDDLVSTVAPASIHEIGCGEGYWVLRWIGRGIDARGSDFSSVAVDIARRNARDAGQPGTVFQARDIMELEPGRDSAELLVCCEVLEHVDEPEAALRVLARVARGHLVTSVPREPLWRILNMARGKYLADFGNTPGHLQHWSKRGFVRLVSRYFEVMEVRSPLPWTMLLCRPRSPD